MKPEARSNKLLLNDKLIKSFEYLIETIIIFEKFKVIIVLLDSDEYKLNSQNIFCVDYHGKERWQIPDVPLVLPPSGVSPYTQIRKEGETIKAFNWDGTIITLNPESGVILYKDWTK